MRTSSSPRLSSASLKRSSAPGRIDFNLTACADVAALLLALLVASRRPVCSSCNESANASLMPRELNLPPH